MAKKPFLSLNESELLRAARVLVNRHGGKHDPLKWWDIYDGLLGRLEKAHFKWEDIRLRPEEIIWRDQTIQKRNRGDLSLSQHKALKIIGFIFNDKLDHGKLRITPKFEEVVNLLQRGKNPEAEPLSPEEKKILARELSTARANYQNGRLSEKRAIALGIVP